MGDENVRKERSWLGGNRGASEKAVLEKHCGKNVVGSSLY
jgi:hypothetical protein